MAPPSITAADIGVAARSRGQDVPAPRHGRRHDAKRRFALASIVLAVVAVSGCGGGRPRTAAEFCRVYYQQEHQYLAHYGHSSPNQPLQDLANVIGAMSDWVPIFQALDQVAPPSIEPDVHNIIDALKQEEQAAGNEVSNPLGAVASGLEAGFMSTASWDNVSQYIQQHCTTGGCPGPAGAASPE